MKANEAPDEIYLLPDDRNPNGLSISWYEAPYATGAIEYTRTDAFIEKACKWFKNNWREYVNTDKDGVVCFGHWEKDFENYMKGE